MESFNPDRTTLVLPLAANKVAVKSGDKKVAENLVLSQRSEGTTFFIAVCVSCHSTDAMQKILHS